jgi:hypothetical protein
LEKFIRDVNMNITEIIKNAFIFPSKNLETLSVFAILSVFSGAFIVEGIVAAIFGIFDIMNLVIGIICIIIAIIIGLITQRISIQCIKSGIDLEEKLPDFNWFQSFDTGFSKVIITIFYFIIPALIVVVIGFITNIFGCILYLAEQIALHAPNIITGNSASATDAIYMASSPLLIALAITISLGLIIFLIFSFFQFMGEARLAHTGSLKEALNIYKAAKDISRIGVGKVILLSTLIFIIVAAIEIVLTIIFDHLLVLSILTIVTTPYLTLFSQRALGLLYSDIV